ncbi:MAG: A/G-specific adenine glycosylase [Armatimonadota bacterium]|nr:MAG: A/G-specific adenine glycosylase [Armatimonadota bacterium]
MRTRGLRPEDLSPPLLAWFDRARRDLPWRRTRDPYRIWVAEVMLQQTQVERVIPYYHRLVEAFPSIRALAAGSLDDLLRVWAGLGYYARARNLHSACRLAVEKHAGRFPDCYADAMALPGVGEYIAGAVLSIAYGHKLPAIDANARRVLSRVLLERGDGSARSRRRIESVARAAMPADRPGDYNQAMMELGALICLPRRPRCGDCCVASCCAAKLAGRQREVPAVRRRGTRRGRVTVGVVWRRGRILIAQRPPHGLWGGLWEFPNAELDREHDAQAALEHLLARDFGITAAVGGIVAALTYGIMNRQLDLTAYSCTGVSGRTKARRHAHARWVRPQELALYALPAPHGRIATVVAEAAVG